MVSFFFFSQYHIEEIYTDVLFPTAVMWGLFTRALTLASSTVRVSVINTSANFFLTALLGAIIFTESLPGKFPPFLPPI